MPIIPFAPIFLSAAFEIRETDRETSQIGDTKAVLTLSDLDLDSIGLGGASFSCPYPGSC